MAPSWLGRCATGPLKLFFRGSLPRADGTFQAEELQQPDAASIARDAAGVPHITAATERDLFFLNGVVHGQDRLWQMQSTRRLAEGRLCEFAGAKALELDRLARQLGFRHLAEGDLAALRSSSDPDAAPALAMLEAFAQGVNWAVAQGTRKGQLPVEFKLAGVAWEPWRAADTLLLARLHGFIMNFGFQHALLRQGLIELFGPEKAAAWTCTEEQEAAIPHALSEAAFRAANLSGVFNSATAALPRGQGSNWWVVHGSHTTTGKPILVGDPHLSIRVPNFWYEVHMTQAKAGSGSVRVYGVAPAGVPAVLIGQNGFLATSITLAYCDVEDVFLERVRRSDGKYLYCGEWHDCEVREETIHVKGAPDESCRCRSTRHGLILEGEALMQFDPFKRATTAKVAEGEEDEDVEVAYAGIPLRPQSLSVLSLYKMLHARSFKDFDQCLAHLSRTYSLNLGYADVEGHIGYVVVGEVPIRGKPGDELLPLLGWTGEHDWRGFVPHSELPKAFDPPEGFIISTNHKIVDYSYYPHYLGRSWKSGYRAKAVKHELEKLLEGGRKIAPGQMPAVLCNVRSWAAVDFVEELRFVRPAPDTACALDMLLAWDFELRADSVVAALYELTHSELVQLLLRRGCEALGVPPAAWNLEQETLARVLAGEGFDPNSLLKIVNEFQGHLHLNLVRVLRGKDAGRRWWLEQAGGLDEAVNAALRAAVKKLRGLAGRGWSQSRRASWGRLHPAQFKHALTRNLGLPPGSPPFDAPSVESPGDTNTILQACPKSLTDFTATAAHVSLRVIFSLADLADESSNRIISPLGQSGQFNSPHYYDQNRMWASGQLRPMIVGELAGRAVATMRFAAAAARGATGPSPPVAWPAPEGTEH